METTLTQRAQVYLVIISVLGWFALAAQFYLVIENRETSLQETLIRYFSFFTILTNILVAGYCTILLLKSSSKIGAFFSRQTVATAITVYIVVVGITYNVVLRSIWNPQGLQKVVDELLHLIIPILFLVYWIFCIKKSALTWQNISAWLIFPFLYCIYVLIRGAISGNYPYPFMDVTALGYNKVLINSGMVTLLFAGISVSFVAIGKMTRKKTG